MLRIRCIRLGKLKAIISIILILSCLNINIGLAAVNTEIYVNGSLLKTDVSPVIIDDITYVPIRNIAEILGFVVNFNEETNVITMTQSELQTTISMEINNTKANVNNQELTMPAPPVVVEERTMVPVRFISEALKSRVNWTEGYEYENIIKSNEVKIFSSFPNKLGSANASISSETYNQSWTLNGYEGKEYTINCDIIIPQLSGMKDTAFQQRINDTFNDISKSMKDDTEQKYEEQKGYNDGASHEGISSITYSVINETENVVSIVTNEYNYTGGAHGMPGRTGVNIDFKQSKILALSDLFKPECDYKQVLLKTINDIRKAQKDKYDSVAEPKAIPFDNSFYFMGNNLVVYYFPYDLSSYARGFVEFEVPLKDLSKYLKDEYLIK